MEAMLSPEEISHVATDPSSTTSPDGSFSSPAPSAAAFPADDDDDHQNGEVAINYLEESQVDNQILVHHSLDELKDVDALKESGQPTNTVIDTAAPFESVRAAVSRFRGISDVKTEVTQNIERPKTGQVEFKKIQEEVLRYRQKYEEAEASKAQLLTEVNDIKRYVEDLKLQVEKAEILEEQAKLDSQLAHLRLREVEDGIDSSESAATKAQLDLAKERHATAAAELESLNRELNSIKSEYASLLQERDHEIRRATEIVSSSKESQKNVNNITLELMKTKELFESVRAAHLRAEERKVAAALTLEIEKTVLEKVVKRAEEELEQLNQEIALTNNLQSRLDQASGLLNGVKTDVDSQTHKNAGSATSSADLQQVKSEIEKTNHRISSLRTELYSLQSELEGEKAASTTFKVKEGLGSDRVCFLDDELKTMNSELQQTLLQREDMQKEEVEKMLQPAIAEAERAKLMADSAREDLRKAKEDVENAKAAATAMEMRITAAQDDMEAANEAVQFSECPEAKATEEEADGSSDGVTMTLEEFHGLSKKANREEEPNEADTEPPEISSKKLVDAKKSLEDKKQQLTEAMDKALMAEEEAILMEQQLRRCREEQGRGAKTDGSTSMPDISAFESDDDKELESALVDAVEDDDDLPDDESPSQLERTNTGSAVPENKRRKRMFLTRMAMFLSRKKQPCK